MEAIVRDAIYISMTSLISFSPALQKMLSKLDFLVDSREGA